MERVCKDLGRMSYEKWRVKNEEVKCQQVNSVEIVPSIGLENLPRICESLLYLYRETSKKAWKAKAEAVNALEERLRSAGSLKAWVSELHEAIPENFLHGKKPKCLRGVKGIGLKGACDIARTLGYFDVAPIDIHEQRFLLRTGIVCRYGPASFDPKDRMSYLETLRNFCREELNGEKVLGIDLGEAPGIVDIAIWCFCSKKGRNICGDKPKCNEKHCPLRNCCLYYFLTHAWKG